MAAACRVEAQEKRDMSTHHQRRLLGLLIATLLVPATSSRGAEISEAALWQKAEEAQKERKWTKAEASLKKLVAEFPQSQRIAEAYYRLSRGQVEQHKYVECLETVDLILKKHFNVLDPALKPLVLWKAGLCCHALSRFDEALKHLDRVIAEYPDLQLLYLPYFYAGECRRAKGEWEQALERYRLCAQTARGRDSRLCARVDQRIRDLMAAHPEAAEKAKAVLKEIKNLPPLPVKKPAPRSQKGTAKAAEARFAFASPIELALAAGNWLVSKAVPETDGYRWLIQEGSEEYGTSTAVGPASVGSWPNWRLPLRSENPIARTATLWQPRKDSAG
jgi:tetratricopeptide (TPR) repeat protein